MTRETQAINQPTIRYEWMVGATDASERPLDDYILALDITQSDLRGRVLDLGSGALQYLNAELKSCGIDADITSVNPDMAIDRFSSELLRSSGYENKTVAAIGQQLPFRDGSFDHILSLGAMTIYAGPDVVPKLSVQAWMSELVRVLNIGGSARLGPVYGEEFLPTYVSYFDEMNLSASLVIEPVVSGGKQLETDEGHHSLRLYRLVIDKK